MSLRRRLRRTRRRLRPYRPALGLLLALAVLSGLWVAVTGVLAARHLRSVQRDLDALQVAVRHDRVADGALQRVSRRAEDDSAAAHRLTSDVAWKVWQRVPLVGRPLQVVSGVGAAAAQLRGGTVVTAVGVTEDLRRARSSDGRLDLEPLVQRRAGLDRAVVALDRAEATLRSLPESGLGPLDRRQAALAQRLAQLGDTVEGLRTAARVGPGMLGASGTRTYLVAVQNNAEARAAGGIVGAFGLLTVEDGRPSLSPFRSDADLQPLDHDAVDLGPEWRHRYDFLGQGRDWREVTSTPDFPTAAVQMLGLWAATHAGQRLDGVVSLDPVALADVLTVTGPVTTDTGRRLDAPTFVRYALSDAYALYPDKARRTEALASAAHAVFDAVVHGKGGTASLAERLGHAVVTHHLALYSSHADEQAQLATTGVTQSLPASAAPFLEVVTQDASGSKLSYYLRRDVRFAPQPVTDQLDLGRGPEPVQRGLLTVTLTSTAPAGGLPQYVAPLTDLATGRSVRPGTERLSVSVYLGRRGVVRDLAVDGRPRPMTSETEQGMSVLTTAVTLQPGQRVTLVMHVLQPAAPGAPLQVRAQPLAFPDTVRVG